MHVLVVESDRKAPEPVVAALERAGHRVSRCYERGLAGFPCAALYDGGHCPLDAEDDRVDVAVDVRAHPWPNPTVLEHGASCAVRAGVPLVVAGMLALNPWERWEAASVDGTAGVVAACERVVLARDESGPPTR